MTASAFPMQEAGATLPAAPARVRGFAFAPLRFTSHVIE